MTSPPPVRHPGVEEREAPLAPHPVLAGYYAEPEARAEFVTELFDRAASHYDWICGAMSFGTGALYRRRALARAGLRPGMRLLDLAHGTGLVGRAAVALGLPARDVIGLDPSSGMLRQSRRLMPLPLVRGVGEQLPFADASFDGLSMGYALRHVADLRAALVEFRRVLRPGGLLLILEITRPASPLGLRLARLYLKRLVPLLARLTTGSRDARRLMEYYWDTIEQCVPPATVLAALAAAGFTEVRRTATGGMLSEYSALAPAG